MLIWQEYTETDHPRHVLPPARRRPLSMSDTGPVLWHWIIVVAWAVLFVVATVGAAGWW